MRCFTTTGIAVLVVAVAGVAACGKGKGGVGGRGTAGETRTGGAEPEFRSKLSAEDRGKVLARVGDTVITLGDFEQRLASQAPYAMATYSTPQRRKEFLDNMIQFEVLAAEAKRRGYDKDPEVVQAMKQTMVRKLMGSEVQELVKLTDISDEEMKKYYDEHQQDYHKPEQVRGSMILTADVKVAERLKKEIEAKIAENRVNFRRIFADYAREHSLHAETKTAGGDLRFFGRDGKGGEVAVPPEVAQAIFGLTKVGDLGGPVKTERGWAVVMLTGRKNAYERTFEQVKRQIQNRLYREKKRQATDAFVEKLKAQTRIERNDDILARLDEAIARDQARTEGGETPPRVPDAAEAGITDPAAQLPRVPPLGVPSLGKPGMVPPNLDPTPGEGPKGSGGGTMEQPRE